MTVSPPRLAQRYDPDSHSWQQDCIQCLHVLQRSSELKGSPLRPCASPVSPLSNAMPSAITIKQQSSARYDHRILTLSTALQESCRISADVVSPHKTQKIEADVPPSSRSASWCPSTALTAYARTQPELFHRCGRQLAMPSASADVEPVEVDAY